MIKHIVLWTLAEDAKKDKEHIAADLQTKFKALLGVIEGLTAIEIGQNYNGGKFDLVLYCEFTSKEMQDQYQKHPAHLSIQAIVHTLMCGRECVDYEQ